MDKTHNVYKDGDRYYVKEIRECLVDFKLKDLYHLTCRIKERGERAYTCEDAPEYIQPFVNYKSLWLTDETKKYVNDVIQDFNDSVAKAKGDSFTEVPIKECDVKVYYRHIDRNEFDCLLDIATANYSRMLKNITLHEMIFEINSIITGDKETLNILKESTAQNIEKNPLFKSAVDRGDLTMQRLIKLYYNIADEKDCEALSKDVFGMRILPSLPEKYNRYYVVDKASIQVDMLTKSEYKIAHRPYFGLNGNTPDKWQLNPCTKEGIDCGPAEAETMSFENYLALFNEKSKKLD